MTHNNQVVNKNNNQVATVEKDIIQSTLDKIKNLENNGGLKIPSNYSVENAMKNAFLILKESTNKDKQPVLQSCTAESISLALLKMVLQGLNPIKNQCSFIAYGNKLVLQREYQGSIALAKRFGVKNVKANAIFKGDEFKWEIDNNTGLKKILHHSQSIESLGAEVIGAYCLIEFEDGRKDVEVMSMNQIKAAWEMGATKGNSDAHKKFPDQMAMKTVINRALKTVINSSDDSNLFTSDDSELVVDPVGESLKVEINEKANKEEIGFEEEPAVIVQEESVSDEPKAPF